MNFARVGGGIHALDIDTDGRVAFQIGALSAQAVFRHSLPEAGVVVVMEVQITTLHVSPKERKEHVTQMPTSHGQLSDYR